MKITMVHIEGMKGYIRVWVYYGGIGRTRYFRCPCLQEIPVKTVREFLKRAVVTRTNGAHTWYMIKGKEV